MKEVVYMEKTQNKEFKKLIENIVWHIETNRDVLGDTRMLDDVYESLKKICERSR